MPRLPYAAIRLISEVQGVKHSAKAQPHGDADGFGVYRTIKFGKRESPVLYRTLLHITDTRIQKFDLTEAGYLHVTFVPGPRADVRDPFYVADAFTVATAEDAGT